LLYVGHDIENNEPYGIKNFLELKRKTFFTVALGKDFELRNYKVKTWV
jgi:hypothetical protein